MSGIEARREIAVAEFAKLVALLSRFLVGLSSIPLFKATDLGLADWVALSMLAEHDNASNKQLARMLGVSNQRANQITTSLSKSGHISIRVSASDSRRNEISITQAGRARLNATNRRLAPLLATVFRGGANSFTAVNRRCALLMRIVMAAKAADDREVARRREI